MIPKIIHQFCIGDKQPPYKLIGNWQEKNPTCEHILWDEKLLKKYFPNGSDYHIQEDGVNLSGGQKQGLAKGFLASSNINLFFTFFIVLICCNIYYSFITFYFYQLSFSGNNNLI